MEEELSSLEARHRKEKKEMQAQVQGLKKAAKNDKSKKKDLIAAIAKLETELDMRHKQEFEEIQARVKPESIQDPDYPESDGDQETTKPKVSKAQKRRDKKLQQEKERAEQIKLQEEVNIHGPRNIEIQTLTARLKGLQLKIHPIPSDGDCLYKAISYQLQSTRETEISVDELRKDVANYIRENKDDFIPFMCNPDTNEMLTDEEFHVYCDKISSTKVWGGQLEIRALSNLLKCPIKVIQATGPESIDQGLCYEGPPLVITYHRHMYSLGEHYNSTQKIIAVDDDL